MSITAQHRSSPGASFWFLAMMLAAVQVKRHWRRVFANRPFYWWMPRSGSDCCSLLLGRHACLWTDLLNFTVSFLPVPLQNGCTGAPQHHRGNRVRASLWPPRKNSPSGQPELWRMWGVHGGVQFGAPRALHRHSPSSHGSL